MRSLRNTLLNATLILLALASIMVLIRPALALPMLAGGFGGMFAWWLGFHQGKRRGWALAQVSLARQLLEHYVHTAEEVLADAPDDLDEDQELMREAFKRQYHEAQRILAELPNDEGAQIEDLRA